jgi:hypothetical protein
MESTSFPDCIQISQVTADLLIAAGKQAWINPRDDMVNAKGKGLMQTYMLEMNKNAASSSAGRSNADVSIPKDSFVGQSEVQHTNSQISSKNARLVEWMAEILMAFIKEIAIRRCRTRILRRKSMDEATFETEIGYSVLGEVKEIVTLPHISMSNRDHDTFEHEVLVDPGVGEQLRHYLSSISLMYPENPCKFPNC